VNLVSGADLCKVKGPEDSIISPKHGDVIAMARYLGIDVGGSATRWHLADEAAAFGLSGADPGFSGHIYRPEVLARAKQAIEAMSRRIGRVDAIIAGITGLSQGTPEASRLHGLMAKAFGTSAVTLMSDIELACRTVFAPGTGILVYAGTGSIAAHVTSNGIIATAGGKGVLIDDAGGGYWIAIRALRAILRAEDTQSASGWSTPLGQCMAETLGGNEWPVVRQAVYRRERGEIGMLALPVGRAATAGDSIALAIMRDAGRELAGLALMLERRVGRHPMSLAGRAATLHPAIFHGMRDALPDRELVLSEIDAAAGAARLAARGPQFADQTRA
jgi:glucosamine kinase